MAELGVQLKPALDQAQKELTSRQSISERAASSLNPSRASTAEDAGVALRGTFGASRVNQAHYEKFTVDAAHKDVSQRKTRYG